MISRRTFLYAGASTAATSALLVADPFSAAALGSRASVARTTQLRRKLDALNYGPHVQMAVFFHELHSGQSFGWHADRGFFTASIVKVDILAALLLQAQARGRTLTASQRSLASAMIRSSSNTAATALYHQIGGVAGLRAANRTMRLDHTSPNRSWGLTTTTARNQVRLLGRICDRGSVLHPNSRSYVRSLMSSVIPSQRWGVSGAWRSGDALLIKDGWLSSRADQGRWIANSVGRINGRRVDLRLAVLTKGHPSYALGRQRVAHVADLVRDTMAW